MSDDNSKLKQAGIFIEADAVDISHAQLDPSLNNVWSNETDGEINVPIDRLYFESLTSIAARFLEPHGYTLNLENMLATIDSTRIGVIATLSSKKSADGRPLAKRIIPSLFMRLPRKKNIGSLLQRFYDEIGQYETALATLHENQAKAQKLLDASDKDERGRKIIASLKEENENLKSELAVISQKLGQAQSMRQDWYPNAQESGLPAGVRAAVVKGVRLQDGTAQLKANESQFSVPLRQIGGIPSPNSRALCFYESGVLKSTWVFDPPAAPFEQKLAEILAVEGKRVKLRFHDRTESIARVKDLSVSPKIGDKILVKLAGRTIIDLEIIAETDTSKITDIIFEAQTLRQL